MTNENIRICRIYCGLSYEDAAETTGIPLNRYKNIETGKVEPTDEEIEKIAKIYNLYSGSLINDFNDNDSFRLIQEVDENFFKSEDLREAVKLKVTSLSAIEKKLIMLIRSTDYPEALIEKLMNEIIDGE